MVRALPLINLPLIALLAWELADWTWRGIQGEWSRIESAVENRAGGEVKPFGEKAGRGELQGLAGLFGQAKSDALVVPQKVTNAPLTRLEAKLLGILSATDNSVVPRAMIVGTDIPEGAYGVGDEVGPALIRGIEWDRVVLDHHGKLETLRLPKLGSDGDAKAEEPADQTKVSAETQALIGKLWGQFESRPESILENIRIEPVFVKGQFSGVQLFPGADPKFLEQFGVQAGDVVNWVNGVELNDPMKGMEVLGKLGTAETMQFRVTRGSESLAFEFRRQ
ncbi:MAG: hypothetical protein HQL99_11595 [Magnetococcales bacterium]|nr:hypothetical protein [Magnetococcales bacterium]